MGMHGMYMQCKDIHLVENIVDPLLVGRPCKVGGHDDTNRDATEDALDNQIFDKESNHD